MDAKVIRVDEEVYRLLMEKQHELERVRGRQVSMSDALRALLEEEAGDQPKNEED